MANHFLSSIYRKNGNDLSKSDGNPAYQGVPMSFPNQGVLIYPPTSVTTANGVTMNSVIEVLPTGLNQPSKYFYSADTVATLNTASA